MAAAHSPIRIGTRKSQLAVTQAAALATAIQAKGFVTEILSMDSLGDRRRDQQQLAVRDKKEWIIDLEEALQEERIDIAIHSGKDVPYDLLSGTELCSVLPREDARDVFIGKKSNGSRLRLADVSEKKCIGSSSLRRKAFLQRWSPFQEISDVRGNVPTRLARLDEGVEFDGIILAAAGLRRLGLFDEEMELLSDEVMVPAMNQGILAAQFLSRRLDIHELCHALCHKETQAAFLAERACIQSLGADCQSSVGVLASSDGTRYRIQGAVLSADGSSAVQAEETFDAATDAATAGKQLAQVLLVLGAGRLLRPA